MENKIVTIKNVFEKKMVFQIEKKKKPLQTINNIDKDMKAIQLPSLGEHHKACLAQTDISHNDISA